MIDPIGEVDPRYSAPDAVAPSWPVIDDILTEAQLYWLSTVRRDGRPHVTPVIAIWADAAAYFCTGAEEQKSHNLAVNSGCVLTTGANSLNEGLDVVIEGRAHVLRDEPTLLRIAAEYVEKYGSDWEFEVADGAFANSGQRVTVYRVPAQVVFAHSKGAFAMVRYRFPAA